MFTRRVLCRVIHFVLKCCIKEGRGVIPKNNQFNKIANRSVKLLQSLTTQIQ
jgi:hypothetical protein